MDSGNIMDKNEIIELEAEEITGDQLYMESILRRQFGVPLIDITPKPKMSWEDVEELYNEIDEEDE